MLPEGPLEGLEVVRSSGGSLAWLSGGRLRGYLIVTGLFFPLIFALLVDGCLLAAHHWTTEAGGSLIQVIYRRWKPVEGAASPCFCCLFAAHQAFPKATTFAVVPVPFGSAFQKHMKSNNLF